MALHALLISALERGVLSTPYTRNRDTLWLVPTDMTLGHPGLRLSHLLALKVSLPGSTQKRPSPSSFGMQETSLLCTKTKHNGRKKN